jgi:Asp-tRNA(Asn)/Glu-tRNA(Gln) amidotransferase A subunit family amidase
MNRVWTYAGLPNVTVPAGTIGSLPVGIQVVGRFDADERVLAWTGGLADVLGR